MTDFLIKHYDVDRNLLGERIFTPAPGEDFMSYTEPEMAVKCGLKFEENKNQKITYEFYEKNR